MHSCLCNLYHLVGFETVYHETIGVTNETILPMKERKSNLRIYLVASLFFGIAAQAAADVLTLDSCRTLALGGNKQLHIQAQQVKAAGYQRKAAFTNYLPKLSATGAYMHSSRELSILNKDQKAMLGNLGTSTQQSLQAMGQQFPELAPVLNQLGAGLQPGLNEAGRQVADAFRTDTRNLFTGAVTLTQPLYIGGKIRAYNDITRYAEALARQQQRAGRQEVILQTDEAYWQVVSLAHKKKLAQSYVTLLNRLDNDMQQLITEGLATRADGLSVKVKLNEAEMTLTKVEDGVSLSRMLLCQLCGLPLDSPITLADEATEAPSQVNEELQPLPEGGPENRPELRSLSLAADIAQSQIKVARSEFLPSLALVGNYLFTNPSLFNGFERKVQGMWNVGVTLQVPLFHWGEGIYKVKAARTEALIAQLRRDEVREKIELQTSQARFSLNEASKRLAMANRNREKADENLRYARLGFEEGVIATSNLLEAQTAWLSAHADQIDAQINARLAHIYLQKALGTLSE